MLRRQSRDLGLTSSTACLLFSHKPNHCNIGPTSKVSVVSLGAPVESALYSLPKSSDSGNDRSTNKNMAKFRERTGVGFRRATSGVIIGPHTSLPKSSFGRGITGRDLESRTQRNH
jgi:hypothetical protein